MRLREEGKIRKKNSKIRNLPPPFTDIKKRKNERRGQAD